MHIFIPYVQKPARWDELRFALRSWAQHAQFAYQIVIVGDMPAWAQNVIHIPHATKYDGKSGEILRDAIAKMHVFLGWMKNRKAEPFIRTYDDIFLLRDVTIADIAIPKAMYDMTRMIPNMSNTWRRQLWSTYHALRTEGCCGWNMESHTPEAFISSFMRQVMDIYRMPPNEYLTSTLYFNQMMHDGSNLRPVVLSKNDHFKAGFYGTSDKYGFGPNEDVAAICAKKMFLNFDDAGFSPAIAAFLENKFPNKCRHEI